jgi:hypothetical protein
MRQTRTFFWAFVLMAFLVFWRFSVLGTKGAQKHHTQMARSTSPPMSKAFYSLQNKNN